MYAIKNIRLKNYDYQTDGYYFVTAICDERKNYFAGKERLVERELKNTAENTTGLKIDYFVVMPNHVHVIFILEKCVFKLSEVVRRFKAKVSHALGLKIWQPNYYEHVIRNEKALEKIRQYIINNPQEYILKFEQFYL